jgi:hypothetical protein
MDRRGMLLEHLTQAEHHVALGKEHIENQQRVIAALHGRGGDTTAAIEFLNSLIDMQTAHEAHRARLIAEIDALDK